MALMGWYLYYEWDFTCVEAYFQTDSSELVSLLVMRCLLVIRSLSNWLWLVSLLRMDCPLVMRIPPKHDLVGWYPSLKSKYVRL